MLSTLAGGTDTVCTSWWDWNGDPDHANGPRGDPSRDHITQNTLTTSDSLDVRETPSEIRNELVHSHDRMSAQIVQHENLRCYFNRKKWF